MKKIILTLLVLSLSIIAYSQNENPFAKFGYDVLVATSSKGEFTEFHDQTDIVEIGSILYNTQTNEIVKLLDKDETTIDISSATPAMSIDPLCEKYYWISPYAYCANNPIKFIDPTGMFYDDYYSSTNGKYLGNDGGVPGTMRLIDDKKYAEIKNDGAIGVMGRMNKLQAEGTAITINDTKIQSDLQSVADNSSSSGLEHQTYIVLDRANAEITSVVGTSGTHNQVSIESYPAPVTGVNFIGQPGGPILIGQAHGHPASITPGTVTAKTMSTMDASTSTSLQIPVYGIDAMDGATNGNATSIHRVTPNGTITNNVGKTSSNFNIGRQSLEIWGKKP